MEDLIKKFLSGYGDGNGSGYGDGSGDGYGNGYGYGYGYGNGYGYGDGYGDGYGYGDGDGSGYGDGNGYGDGYGNGSGYGSGYGYGYGNGYGNGEGEGIKRYNNENVYYIDGVQTIIRSIRGLYAIGAVIRKDMTLKECYIAKCHCFFAHGDTLADAIRDAESKYNRNLPVEQRISEFINKYPTLDTIVSNRDLYDWHHILTGSCKMGRDEFVESNNIDIDSVMTVRQFIDLTINSYNGSIIELLKSKY